MTAGKLQRDNDKAMALSDLDATNFELEQAVLESSMHAYRAAESSRKQKATDSKEGRVASRPRRRPTTAVSSSSSSSSQLSSSLQQLQQHEQHLQASSYSYSSSSPTAGTTSSSSPSSAAASIPSVASVPSASTESSSSSPASPADRSGSGSSTSTSSGGGSSAIPTDEYPQTVQELVMNGFELSKVVHAYELIGDNFDDLLAFLVSTAGT
uniref:UBA domain-containing protein n=1 Tax=Cyclophora tenuis TaxID=216820 RepID=A0A7S1DBC8_CYCTE|mmetsp:Transcript_4665/g.8098  ORF Transcript_4665/g.8098 Transcript_4665/m.8098 type:complete len:211 (+) Transcript_4665:143-775(+)